MKYLKCFVITILLLFTGCDKGIEPDPDTGLVGFKGTISFTGSWPDSIKRTHLVVFKNPLNTVEDFNAFNLAFVSIEIPYGLQEYPYSTLDSSLFPINAKLEAGTYSYIAVAQQKTEVISLSRSDWIVVGLFSSGGSNTPGVLTVPAGTLVENINIICDFNNPPPQPPGGIQNE